MEEIIARKVLDKLSEIVPISKEKKSEMLERFSLIEDKYVIKDLAVKAYSNYRNNEPLYTRFLEIIMEINPSLCRSVDYMKEVLRKRFLNDIDGNMPLDDNHKLVNNTLVDMTSLFNMSDIDYYLVGALSSFIKTGQPLFRYHDDIDIMINEDDIPKASEIMKAMGYSFYDDRYPSTERVKELEEHPLPHIVLAQNPDNEFHVGFFVFRRNPDNSIVERVFSHKIVDNQVEVGILERAADLTGTNLRYDETPTEYLGTSFKTSSIEFVYSLKSFTRREKDITDMEVLQPFVDEEKLKELKNHPLKRESVKPKEEIKYY